MKLYKKLIRHNSPWDGTFGWRDGYTTDTTDVNYDGVQIWLAIADRLGVQPETLLLPDGTRRVPYEWYDDVNAVYDHYTDGYPRPVSGVDDCC